ncbi:MAG: 2-C-methyl-D-erythritol 4-phosphate cytidylyltransferase, partial [Tepidisphaeraceae bacterium]
LTAAPVGQTAATGGAMMKLDGRDVLLRSGELLLNRENLKQINVVIAPEAEEEVKRKLGGALGFMGVKLTVGGRKWSEQIAAALAKINPESTHVLVHDAARPLVPQGDVDAILEAAAKAAAVALTAPLRASLVELDEGGGALAVRAPGEFAQLLTPHVYSRQRFSELAAGRDIHPTEFTLVKGSSLNIRLAGAGDGGLAKAMLNLMPKPKSKAPSNPFEEAQW